jgi:2-haloacid dehalogenase
MNMINTIIFDLGGVLIDWNPDYLYEKIFSDPEQRKWFYENVCTPDWNEEQDAGRGLQKATELLISEFPEHEENIRHYYGRWTEMLKGPIQGTVEVFKELKDSGRYKIYALTNWSQETFPVALERFDFLHWFDGRLVSGEEMTRKPFPDIYEKLIQRFSIDPTKALFTDDNPRNLKPAEEIGMKTIHFINPDQFRIELVKLGLL